MHFKLSLPIAAAIEGFRLVNRDDFSIKNIFKDNNSKVYVFTRWLFEPYDFLLHISFQKMAGLNPSSQPSHLFRELSSNLKLSTFYCHHFSDAIGSKPFTRSSNNRPENLQPSLGSWISRAEHLMRSPLL